MPPSSPLIPVLTGHSAQSQRAGPFELDLVEHAGDVALSRHRHREAVIGLLMRGTYDEWLDGRTVEPGRASLLIKPPETPHANRIGRDGTHTILIQVQPDVIPADLARVLERPAIHVHARIHAIGERLLRELQSGDADELGLESLIVELLDFAVARRARRGIGCSPRQQWVARAREYIRANVAARCTLADVARAAGVERAHLARTFRAALGCTLGEYLRAARLERAAERLRDGRQPLALIALESGFADQAHLTRVFRQAFRVTPGRYRAAERRSQTSLLPFAPPG